MDKLSASKPEQLAAGPLSAMAIDSITQGNGAQSSSAPPAESSHQHQHQHSARAAAAAAALPLPMGVPAARALDGVTVASLAPGAASSAGHGTPSMEHALGRFKGGIGQFQQLLEELSGSVDRERDELRRARDQLNEDKRAFEEECLRVQHELHASEQVVLNIGGHKFTTTAGTLRNAPCPSLFSAMFSGRHALRTDESGCYFLDRDGRHFHDILNFLRDGMLSYPADGTDFKYLLELRAEAEYYGLVGLVQQIDRYPYGLVRVQRAATLNMDDSWMYEDGQDEVVFTVSCACQLLGVGLCGTEGGITVELEVYEVEPADFSAEVGTLQTAAQSFTKGDGQVVRMLLPAPALLRPCKYYMLSALIKGSESYCCEDGMEVVIAGGVKVTFQSWESPNGTNEQRGQFPEIYLRAV